MTPHFIIDSIQKVSLCHFYLFHSHVREFITAEGHSQNLSLNQISSMLQGIDLRRKCVQWAKGRQKKWVHLIPHDCIGSSAYTSTIVAGGKVEILSVPWFAKTFKVIHLYRHVEHKRRNFTWPDQETWYRKTKITPFHHWSRYLGLSTCNGSQAPCYPTA